VSSAVTAPEGLPSRLNRATRRLQLVRERLTGDFVLGLLGAIALGLVIFVAKGGNGLTANTWIQGGMIVIAAAVAVAAVLFSERGRGWGGLTAAVFLALAALTYASIGWSVQPANSWLEGNRTLSYLAAFTTALLLARLVPRRWPALIGALATASTVACGYALLVKVFPGSLDPHEVLGRLRAPFDYWNAVGLMGAIGLPPCLWAGSRRDSAPVLRALAVPAIAVLLSAVVLSFSRGAVLVAAIGVGAWFSLAPVRLRSALVLLLGAAGGAAISAWGAASRGISADNVSGATRISAGHEFGIVIIVALILTTIAGAAASYSLDRVNVSASLRRRLGYLLIALVALIPVGGVVALAKSSRGFTGEVSHLWNTVTSTTGASNNQPGRLVDLSNSRPRYWRVALKIGEHHPLAGVGALGFATAQSRYSTGGTLNPVSGVQHAHGYVVETFADFGAIGLAISAALLIAWGFATARTFEIGRFSRRARAQRAPPAAPVAEPPVALVAERTGLIALLAIVLAFGVHSLVDWTWFIPGDAVAALICAGWLAGRGPLSQAAPVLPRRRVLTRSPAAVLLVTSIAVIAVVALWGIAEPLRASDSYFAASAAAIRGDAGAAVTDARTAANEDPVDYRPLFLLSRLYSDLGQSTSARRELRDAVSRQPANPETWSQLGCYDLTHRQPTLAQAELRRALTLEPGATQISTDPTAYCESLSG
jgi:hypothetical protein